MILRALHTKGILDVSSQETHRNRGSAGEDFLHFRLSLKPGQVVEVDDRYRRLKNIDSAINAGLLEVISLDPAITSTFIHTEAAEGGQGTIPGEANLDAGETGTVDEVDLTECRTVKWFISVTDGTNGTILSTEIFANHDGTAACWTEHSLVGSADTTFEVDVDTGKIRLRATALSDDQAIKSERICVSA
jgi:hypothetical protein